jgi:spoIIIJ-associated protein
LEDQVEIAKQLMIGLLDRMDIQAEVEGSMNEGSLVLEIKGDKDGILIGKHGRTLEAIQLLINRMVTQKLKEPVRVVVDIDHYRTRRADALTAMATRIGERVRLTGKAVTIGPFNAQERRIIHMALKDDPAVTTESLGEGAIKKIIIALRKREGEGGNFE